MGNKNQRDGKIALHHFHGCTEYALWKKAMDQQRKNVGKYSKYAWIFRCSHLEKIQIWRMQIQVYNMGRSKNRMCVLLTSFNGWMKKLTDHLRNGGIKEFGKTSLLHGTFTTYPMKGCTICVITRQRICFPLISLSLKHWTYLTDWNILVFSSAPITDTKVLQYIYSSAEGKELRAGFALGRQQRISTVTPAVSPARNRHKAELFP